MAPPDKITRRQREVLDYLSKRAAFSREKAHSTYGTDSNVAEKLASLGVINKRYDASFGAVYWIRAEAEPATGASVPAGFVVILHRDVATPSGRMENFFLARAAYDGKGVTFRRLLRDWMTKLGLRTKDLLGGYAGFEVIPADSAVFEGDHLILDAKSVSPSLKGTSHARAQRSLADRIAHAESEAARHLGNHNEYREAGREKAAERSFWAAQRWLDRANALRGQGS